MYIQIYSYPYDLRVENNFINKMKIQTIKEKNDKFDWVRIINFPIKYTTKS